MEVAAAEKEAGMTEWTDGRLDELSKQMDQGFARADKKMDEGFARADQKMNEGFARADQKMNEGFARVDRKMVEGFSRVDADIRELTGRFDALQQTLVRVSTTMSVAMFSVFAALLINHF